MFVCHYKVQMFGLPSIILFAVVVQGGDVVDVQEIVRKADTAMQADWAAAPDFAFIQRDAMTSKGVTTSKTHHVFMIAGSDYYMPIAIGDNPLSADQNNLELEKLGQEVERRNHETPDESRRRSERYRKLREQNGILLNEFTQAFDFALAGQETVNGHEAYVLSATPRAGYRPPNRTAKVLTGMRGRLWIDKESFHWVKAEADALKPVSVFGLFAHVLAGSRMELEMTPVTDAVWLISRFEVCMRLSIFWRKSETTTETTFSEYEAAASALARTVSQ
jgi:hypothetical protein